MLQENIQREQPKEASFSAHVKQHNTEQDSNYDTLEEVTEPHT